VLTLEKAIQRLTTQPADFLGIKDRGRLAAGACADIVVFDPATVGPGKREKRFDLPSGGKRIVVHSVGIDHTLVNGTEIFSRGSLTGARPGTVLHS
jgi:N-acyl-D-aspartate/D-glutamate deacylase